MAVAAYSPNDGFSIMYFVQEEARTTRNIAWHGIDSDIPLASQFDCLSDVRHHQIHYTLSLIASHVVPTLARKTHCINPVTGQHIIPGCSHSLLHVKTPFYCTQRQYIQ